jgi:YidC/Oxa1 family membrane protein insertase
MDKNTFTGLFLIMLILVGGFYLIKPSDDEMKKAQLERRADSVKKGLIKSDSIKSTAAITKTDTAAQTQAVDSAVLKTAFGAATIGSQKLITLQNQAIKVQLSTLGGKVNSVELKKYKTFDKKPLILFDGNGNKFGATFSAGGKNINTNNLYFAPAGAATDTSVTLRLAYTPTQYIDYVYTLHSDGFKLGLTIKATGLDNVISNSGTLNLNWAASLHKQEKDMVQERTYSTVYFKDMEDKVDYLSVSKDEQKDIADNKVQWISFKQHFFSNVLIVKQGAQNAKLAVSHDVNDTTDVKQMSANLVLSRTAEGTFPMEFYFGPNQFSILKDQGYELQNQVDMGWGPLKYINRLLWYCRYLTSLTSLTGVMV